MFLLPVISFTSVKPAVKIFSQRSTRSLCSFKSFISEEVEDVRSKKTTVFDKITQCIERIEKSDPKIRAYLSVHGEEAVQEAKILDRKINSADNQATLNLPLLGLPVAVKDNICTKGKETTAASKILGGYVPSYDATAVRMLREAGAIVIGKTNMDEFGMGSTTENSGYFPTKNPANEAHSPGGSSGGSAAAVASGTVVASLGTDTGGSIRQPASWCGIVGLKPTYGRVSRSGLIAYASSLDCIGPIARSVSDAAILLEVMAGADVRFDSTSEEGQIAVPSIKAIQNQLKGNKTPLKGLRIGVIKEAFQAKNLSNEVASAVKESTDAMERKLGAEIVDVSLTDLKAKCAAYYINALSEASANLARYDGVRYGKRGVGSTSMKVASRRIRSEEFGDEVRQRILVGTFSLSAGYSDKYYNKAMAIRRNLSQEFKKIFSGVDVLVCPSSPTTAYKLGDYFKKGVKSYEDDLLTVPASLAGLPAISLPCGTDQAGMPIGLQIIGNKWREDQIIYTALAFERMQDS